MRRNFNDSCWIPIFENIICRGKLVACLKYNLKNVIYFKAANWEFDLINATGISSDPSVIDLSYKVDRISRGVYGISGYFNLSVDLDDETIINATLFRSNRINGPFIKTPMAYIQPLSKAMNGIYKNSCMESMHKCVISGNAPYFEDTFEPPLTARSIVLDKCVFSTDNLPNNLAQGYYMFRIAAQHPVEVETIYVAHIKRKL